MNARTFFSTQSIGAFHSWPLYLRASTWLLSAALVIIVVFSRANRELAAYDLVVLGLPLVTQFLFYTVDGWREFRMTACFHALAGLSFLARAELGFENVVWRRIAVVASTLLIIVNLSWLTLGISQHYEKNWKHRVVSMDLAGRALFDALGPPLRLSARESGACQTIYTPAESFNDARIIHLPWGVGVSALQLDQNGALPRLKGKYALIAERYVTTRAGLRAMAIDPDNHEAIIGAELAGRIPQGRSSGWADDDPRNPKPDINQLFAASREWHLVSNREEYSLYQSTVNCQSVLD